VNQETAVAQAARDDKTIFGFWVYLMTDCILFATLFATYAVLRNNTFGGPSGRELFDMPYALAETLLLLTSSFTCGLMALALRAGKRGLIGLLLTVTFVLGLAFITMELTEFAHFVAAGNSWRRSGFLSAFFTLVGTHGLHITIGLLWIAITGTRLLRQGLTPALRRHLTLFSLFWHFLDVVWVFIFTIVYLMGAAR
jgi:cytochrome o ubiquinol oxidase subunit III